MSGNREFTALWKAFLHQPFIELEEFRKNNITIDDYDSCRRIDDVLKQARFHLSFFLFLQLNNKELQN